MSRPAAIGLVLAGGSARRMQPTGPVPHGPVRKEAIEVAGATFLERVVSAVARETERVVVVTAPGRPLPAVSRPVEVVHDSAAGSGPLAAIGDGLAHLGAAPPGPDPRLVFVASCDLPLLDSRVVRLLLDRAAASGADWTAPEIDGHVQVLASVVRPALAPRIAGWLAAGRRDPRGLFAMLAGECPGRTCMVGAAECAAVDPGLESFRDVDTPADRERVVRQLTYGERPGEAYTPPS